MATHQIGKLKFNISREGLAYKWGDGSAHYINSPFQSDSRAEEDAYEDDYQRGSRYDDGYDVGDEAYDEDDYGQYDDEDEGGSFMQYIEDHDWVTLASLVVLPPLGVYLLWRRNRYDKPVRIGLSAAAIAWFLALIFLVIPAIFGGNRDGTTPSQQATMTFTTLQPVSTQAAVAATLSPISGDTGALDKSLSGDDGSADLSQTGDATAADSAEAAPTPLTGTASLPGSATLPSGDDPNATPIATPIAGAAVNSTASDYVYSPATGLYYHAIENCPDIPAGVTTTRMALSAALNRGQSPCPTCYGGTLYYATENGTHYHSDPTCSNMVNPGTITQQAAEAQGKTACPVCILHTQDSLAGATLAPSSKYSGLLKDTSRDKSGIKVWCTAGGVNYHTKSTCRGMSGASQVTLLEAIKAGKTPCSTCASSAGTKVWCTKDGTYYHSKSDCSGMKGASQVTYAEALVLGKKRCSKCFGKSSSTGLNASLVAADGNSGSAATTTGSKSSASNVYVYATPNGKYYHTKRNCSGMTGASRVTLDSMLKEGRDPCPTCCGRAGTTVYGNEGGKYYHSKPSCQNMTSAKSMSLATALASGKTKCPYCWDSSGAKTASSTVKPTATPAAKASTTNAASKVYVYATSGGKYYHTNSTCSNMKNAKRVTLSSMLAAGRTACPVCAASASRTVYASKNDKYYHYSRSHAGSGAVSGTLSEALAYGLRACPTCVSGSATAKPTATAAPKASTANYKSGTSGIKVYATTTGKYYHTKSHCSGMTGAAYVSLETALNAKKTACPVCAGSAAKTVYSVKGDKYYHSSRSHAGSGAKSGTLGEALAYGLKACPTCVTSSGNSGGESSGGATYKSGTSGIKVYATVNGRYYHTDRHCSGMTGASRMTLENALNHNKTACPVCCASGGKTVYAVKGSKYYHYSSIHAGSGAKAGTLDAALAYGLKPCPECVSGSSPTATPTTSPTPAPTPKPTVAPTTAPTGQPTAAPTATPKVTASPYSATVYIDLNSASMVYHKSSHCSAGRLSSGTGVTLEFALDQGFSPCPYCNPPTKTSN